MSGLKKHLNNIEGNVCALLMAVTLTLLTYQVVLRSLRMSNAWSEELARYLFIWLIFMGASMAAQQVAHITIDTMLKIWPKKIRRYMQIIGVLIWIAFCIIIIYYSANYALMLHESKRISLSLYIDLSIPYAAIPVGYAFTTIRIIQRELIPLLRKKEITKAEGVDL